MITGALLRSGRRARINMVGGQDRTRVGEDQESRRRSKVRGGTTGGGPGDRHAEEETRAEVEREQTQQHGMGMED